MSNPAHDTHHLRIGHGKHKGELYTRIPASYLRWMVNEAAKGWHFAQAELDRRGTKLPDIEVSRHAIDRASIRCRKIWHNTKLDDEEGILSWIERIAQEAMDADPGNETEAYRYQGLQIIIQKGERYPIVKTIMPKRAKQNE